LSPSTSQEPSIGKRPLSSFIAQPAQESPAAEPPFTPETTVWTFRWPGVCQTLREQFGDRYDRVADLLVAKCRGERSLFGVAGLHPHDGCTTTLLCLAAALAAQGKRVILVDANFRAPALAKLLGAEPNTTWQDVLERGAPLVEAVIRAARDHVDLLPLGARSRLARHNDGAQLAAGLQSSVTADVLREAYDLVLLDLGALLAPRAFSTIDHLLRNMRIDAAVAVSDPRHAAADDLKIAGELLEESGCELLGVIENRIS
jgi:Mrp family chromosome partitioning ATPase